MNGKRRKIHNIFFATMISFCLYSNFFGAFVAHDLGGGRLGDKILCYLHAKWISFISDTPLLYQPFYLSDQFAFHYLEDHFNHYEPILALPFVSIDKLHEHRNKKAVHVIKYFSEDKTEHTINANWLFFEVGWHHAQFKKAVQRLVDPVNRNLQTIILPNDRINVALHVRIGEGFDYASGETERFVSGCLNTSNRHPLKFPPFSFYVDQLKKLSEYFNHQNLYVYVFTDVVNSHCVVEKLKKEFNNFDNVMFDYRKDGNAHNCNVIEDFFALTKFDCLIRSQSNFSLVAAKIADYLVEMFPVKYHHEGKHYVIDETKAQSQYSKLVEQLMIIYKHKDLFCKKNNICKRRDRKSSYPFVSGDSFRAMADHIYDETDRSLRADQVKEQDIIFLKTDYMEEFFTTIHPHITNKYILITHNSDFSAPGKYIKYLEDPKIIVWFGINPSIAQHEKFVPIPIGIANGYWKHGKIETFIDVLKDKNEIVPRNTLLGMNFQFTTQVRKPVYNLFSRATFCNNLFENVHANYLSRMMNAKFILSPPGNGLDCHRTWEALLMGAIPIVETSNLDVIYNDLPVVIVNTWDEITEEFLNSKYNVFKMKRFNYNKCLFDFWNDLIQSYRKGC